LILDFELSFLIFHFYFLFSANFLKEYLIMRLIKHTTISIIIIVFCLAVFSPSSMAISKKKQKIANAHYKLGISYFNNGDTVSALDELLLAQSIDKKNPDIKHALGLAYADKQQYDDAEEYMRKAIKLYKKQDEPQFGSPGLGEAYNNLGAIYLRQGKWDEAIENFEMAVIDPRYRTPDRAYNNLGWAYYNKGNYKIAMQSYRQSIQANRSFWLPYNNMGIVQFKLENYPEAEKSFLKAIEYNPEWAESYYRLGLTYQKMDRRKQAYLQYKKCSKLENSDVYITNCKQALKMMR
jgi:Tfp pilus assembly protein PilF